MPARAASRSISSRAGWRWCACATTGRASPRRNCRWRYSAMPPARSQRSRISRRSPALGSGARRCPPWVRWRVCASAAARRAPTVRRKSGSKAASPLRRSRRPTRRGRPWKCASCSSTCRRAASSCAPSLPSSVTSPASSSGSRWRRPRSDSGCGITAARRWICQPPTTTPRAVRAWRASWARNFSNAPCAWRRRARCSSRAGWACLPRHARAPIASSGS